MQIALPMAPHCIMSMSSNTVLLDISIQTCCHQWFSVILSNLKWILYRENLHRVLLGKFLINFMLTNKALKATGKVGFFTQN